MRSLPVTASAVVLMCLVACSDDGATSGTIDLATTSQPSSEPAVTDTAPAADPSSIPETESPPATLATQVLDAPVNTEPPELLFAASGAPSDALDDVRASVVAAVGVGSFAVFVPGDPDAEVTITVFRDGDGTVRAQTMALGPEGWLVEGFAGGPCAGVQDWTNVSIRGDHDACRLEADFVFLQWAEAEYSWQWTGMSDDEGIVNQLTLVTIGE